MSDGDTTRKTDVRIKLTDMRLGVEKQVFRKKYTDCRKKYRYLVNLCYLCISFILTNIYKQLNGNSRMKNVQG
jgi:hypothetical protein